MLHWTGHGRAEGLNRVLWRRTISVGSVLAPPIRYKTRRKPTLGPRALLRALTCHAQNLCLGSANRQANEPSWNGRRCRFSLAFHARSKLSALSEWSVQPTASYNLSEVDAWQGMGQQTRTRWGRDRVEDNAILQQHEIMIHIRAFLHVHVAIQLLNTLYTNSNPPKHSSPIRDIRVA